ncbi:MAG: 50S ribosomal protein L9 [Candidatus Omnitrophica bacterium]|nr:50S ribosomal protein L9 [Candidatus Omnitrophota bacterium]
MKVILLKDMDKLGEVGDEVQVKDGYARNYLIPRKIAMESSKGALQVIEKKKKEKALRQERLRQESEQMAEKIKSLSCTISMEAGEEDKLFGAVTSDMIAETLRSEGVEVDKKQILLDQPLKALGVYNVDVRLHPEVTAQARVWVVKK